MQVINIIAVFTQFKNKFPKSLLAKGGLLRAWQFWVFFILGVLSKTIATVVTYPLQTAQSVIRSMMGSAWRASAQKVVSASKPTNIDTKIQATEATHSHKSDNNATKGKEVTVLTVLQDMYNTDGIKRW